ncbi:Gfo/Idh/MocA family protein [Mucilaginibacter myungsuensis]|uniref:Gfo/Idh/MocA family oxidoreductase n=1 Tax=Mucilaginibacter myungsuensis TaxID=649104 RepID=A0A929PYN8_9SPHI|nr:Gfo/Idh/MocA family oxidoreductase [Mucilaginibacter myungsuensis]MBE9663650.1 Gfo/Idh/MocA family oxidoreductase [Mucilaginibacter myungsuensis]MDN3599026.1 Gfo/Idh/MocA family oxidoreductase [Mucilaginibacter myungsuensis]
MKENEEKAEGTTRRDFVKTGAVAAAAFSIVPRFVLGKGYRAPSDTLYIASVGVNGKGESDLREFVKSGKAKPQFLCDVDQVKAAGTYKQYPDAKRYVDYREMLDKESKNFDAVHCATPDHMHAVVATAAMSMKKHIYVQKPMAHDVYEARMMSSMADKYKIVSQMGNQGSSSDGVRLMQEWYDAGLIGDIKEVYCWTNRPIWPQGNGMKWPTESREVRDTLNWDLWQGTAKARPYPIGRDQGGIDVLPFSWRGWWDYGTGVLGDMGAHILHAPMKVLGLKYVTSVQSSVGGGGSLDVGPSSNYTVMSFPKSDKTKGPVKVHWMDGGILPPRPEELEPEENWAGIGDGGMLFVGTKGKMTAGCYAEAPRLLGEGLMDKAAKIKPKYDRVKGSTGGHYAQWVEACLAGYGNAKTSSPMSEAGLLTEAMLMCNLAIRGVSVQQGRRYPARFVNLEWDAANLKVTNVDEVNQFVKRTYRDGYSLSGI